MFFFLIHIFIKIILDSYEVIRVNTESSYVYLIQLSPIGTLCKTVVQYYNPDTDLNTIHQS